MCEHAIKKLSFVIRYVPHRHKTQQMCDKAILKNSGVCFWLQQKSADMW